jgi:hypothetical protein
MPEFNRNALTLTDGSSAKCKRTKTAAMCTTTVYACCRFAALLLLPLPPLALVDLDALLLLLLAASLLLLLPEPPLLLLLLGLLAMRSNVSARRATAHPAAVGLAGSVSSHSRVSSCMPVMLQRLALTAGREAF